MWISYKCLRIFLTLKKTITHLLTLHKYQNMHKGIIYSKPANIQLSPAPPWNSTAVNSTDFIDSCWVFYLQITNYFHSSSYVYYPIHTCLKIYNIICKITHNWKITSIYLLVTFCLKLFTLVIAFSSINSIVFVHLAI